MPPVTASPPSRSPPEAHTTLAPPQDGSGLALSGSTAAMNFTPFMMGDLPTTSYICGMVCFPAVQVVNIPPVTRQTTPTTPNQPGPGLPAPGQPSQVVVTPGRQVI